MSPPISCTLEKEEWEFFYNALTTMQLGVTRKDAQSRRLLATLGMTRILLSEKIRGWNGKNTIDLSLFICSLKTIRKISKDFEYYGIKRTDFLILLENLVLKFEKQKLVVKKPLFMLGEFSKMKEVVGCDSLR